MARLSLSPTANPPHLSRSEAETEAAGAELARAVAPDGVLLLLGELGSGKTVLVRGIAAALGVEPREIQSPTYALIHEHEGERGRLVHVDLYRLERSEVGSLGLEELLDGPGVKAIECADRLPVVPPDAVTVRLEKLADGGHKIIVEHPGAGSAEDGREVAEP